MARIRFEDTAQGIEAAVRGVFDAFGGAGALLKASGDVFLKVNGIDSKPHVYTSPEVVSAVVRYFKAWGAHNVYVMENITQGNFTPSSRGHGHAPGVRGDRRIPVYLDETAGDAPVLEKLQSFVAIPDFIHEHLNRNRGRNLYTPCPSSMPHHDHG
jgi:uncharacterized protein (DUF362 family)